MKISVFGSGYVGLVSGACLADVGNDVLCADVDLHKVNNLNLGKLHLFEPGLEALIKHNLEAGRLRFTCDMVDAVEHGHLLVIAVGTPSDEQGGADLSDLMTVAETIGKHINGHRVIINKSTVPVGGVDKIKSRIDYELSNRSVSIDYDVVANPEFMKEGSAVEDFMKPDRIILGTNSSESVRLLKNLYAPFNRNRERVLIMDVRSAELTKYAANAMLATKISFINEMANIAERCGADIEKVRIGIGSDPRIGYQFIYPGCGYGGSCFPKDVKALIESARKCNWEPRLLTAVDKVNERQKNVLVDKIEACFGSNLKGLTFALWGLAFKPNTSDMREAPSCILISALLARGARIRAHDPEAMNDAYQLYGKNNHFQLFDQPYAALDGADALIVVTEWLAYRSLDFTRFKSMIKRALLFDGRNLFDPAQMAEEKIQYYGVGRGLSVHQF